MGSTSFGKKIKLSSKIMYVFDVSSSVLCVKNLYVIKFVNFKDFYSLKPEVSVDKFQEPAKFTCHIDLVGKLWLISFYYMHTNYPHA